MYLSLDSKEFPEIENLDLSLDDTMIMTMVAKVTGINRNKDPETDSEYLSVSLEAQVQSFKVKEINLKEALTRAGQKEGLLVRTHVAPSP